MGADRRAHRDDLDEALEELEAVIITRGKDGSTIYSRDGRIDIPVVPVEEPKDPTGCGDAYRAGLLFGLANGLGWETTGRIASLLGAIKIAENGTQNHRFSIDEFHRRYRDAFGSDLVVPQVEQSADMRGQDGAA